MKFLLVGTVALAISLLTLGVAALVTRGSPSSAQPIAALDGVGVEGVIDYVVKGSDGNIKEQGEIRNTVNPEALNQVFQRVAGSATGGPYDRIAALSADIVTDDPADGVLASSITLQLDGDSGASGNQNPARGIVATLDETGNGAVQVVFTAAGIVEIKQIVLTKASADDTASNGPSAIGDADIFAYQDIPDIALVAGDTVQFTWAIDFD